MQMKYSFDQKVIHSTKNFKKPINTIKYQLRNSTGLFYASDDGVIN